MRGRLSAAAAVFAAALGFMAAGPARAADQSVIDAANKEGKVVFYTGIERPAAEALIAAFKKKYPSIDAEAVRASSSKLATRLDAEIEANRVEGDVFEFSLTYLTDDLKNRGEILHYDSPEYAAYPAQYKDPGYWAATGISSVIILVNTDMVDAANMPTSWWDLTKPFWKDKLTIDNLEVSGTGYSWLIAVVNNDKLGWKYIEALGKNNISLERGHAGMAQKVAAGEYAAATEMSDFHMKNLRNASASVPVRGIWPTEGVPQEPWTAGILKRAPHPNAAKLFLDFLLSKEGQTLYASAMGWTSARTDGSKSTLAEAPDHVTKMDSGLTPEQALKVRDEYVARWKKLWNVSGDAPTDAQ
jgi:iron(III) transport system substrate-binding protein